jgi:hypothetical protein
MKETPTKTLINSSPWFVPQQSLCHQVGQAQNCSNVQCFRGSRDETRVSGTHDAKISLEVTSLSLEEAIVISGHENRQEKLWAVMPGGGRRGCLAGDGVTDQDVAKYRA